MADPKRDEYLNAERIVNAEKLIDFEEIIIPPGPARDLRWIKNTSSRRGSVDRVPERSRVSRWCHSKYRRSALHDPIVTLPEENSIMSTTARCIATLTLVLAPGPLFAQGSELGQREYLNSCAQCHGASGAGDGVMVEFLSSRAPALTTLQKENGGVFPVARLYGVIEGDAAVGAHGTSEMPAWGERYNAKAQAMLGEMYTSADQEAFVRGRILALIEHVSTLQEE